jgi:MoxR-like ATPase
VERPFYRPVGDEVEVFRAAAERGLPVLLKGPTGCGKTRFVEAMAHDLGRQIYTVAGHEDLTSADLVGRFLLKGGETTWVDGPLTRAVREGAIAYLDEVVEARQDTTVVIHPLTDHRRQLPVDRLGITLDAAPGFQLVISYNPGYQSVLKDLKDSTRQRFVAIELDFPPADVETDQDCATVSGPRRPPSAGRPRPPALPRGGPRAGRGGFHGQRRGIAGPGGKPPVGARSTGVVRDAAALAARRRPARPRSGNSITTTVPGLVPSNIRGSPPWMMKCPS